MPTHGTAPEEVLELVTRAGGTWWLFLAAERPLPGQAVVELAAVAPVEVARSAAFWDDPADEAVQALEGVLMPAATEDTVAVGWVLCDDEDGLLPRFSRWFKPPASGGADPVLLAGQRQWLAPEVLELRFTPPTYQFSTT